MPASRTSNVKAVRPSSRTASQKMKHSPDAGRRFPVVAIGASAGGLDALRNLLRAIPADSGMAYIFVQHLAPGHQSLIADLLAGNTPMMVTEASDGTIIEREHLYVIPPGAYLSVAGGMLHVAKAPALHGARLPFDFLLQSLADDAGSCAICVVLSGTGSDGSAGLAAIKQKGGLVIVQNPQDAAYDGMPGNAVMTGLADHILALQEIPDAIATFVGAHAEASGAAPRPATTLSEIIELLRVQTSHDFTLYKQGTLRRRVERRMGMKEIAVGDKNLYLDLLRADPDECEHLAKDLLINVTSFFRDSNVYDDLRDKIIPDLIRGRSSDHAIRIWIAGCSTGEEAYSMAILFREVMADTGSSLKIQLFASDVDEDAVAAAREGFYSAAIEADVSAERLSNFFSKEDLGYRVLPEIRSSIVFTVHDVLADPPFSRIDMVSCRNLLIYLEPESQAKAIALFHFALCDGGILLLGSSETAGRVEGRFETISKPDRVYRRIGHSRPGEMMFSLGVDSARMRPQSSRQPYPPRSTALADLCRQLVLENFAPAAILINQKNECLYSLGHIARYLALAPGYPTVDLFAMAPQNLHIKLRSAIQRCRQQSEPVIVSGGEISGEDYKKRFDIHVRPVENEGQSLFLICFVDRPEEARRVAGNAAVDSADLTRVRELESELEATRTELNGAIRNLELSGEEQKAVNEEALSFNEEYQSANEELLTSKEELQSLNEELTALNGQLQETLERQRTTSNDLQNILYSTAVATLFLDADLRIRFFTPATKTLFNVIVGDIGRPLADLSSLAVDTTLLSDAALVLADHVPLERNIEARSGLWYMRRIMPYLDEDRAVEGVVITFVDVSELRRTSEALQEAKRQAEAANAAKSRFLAAASHDLRQPLQTISLLQSLLVRRVKEDGARALLVRLDGVLGTMSGMLNDLLDINEIEAGKVTAEMGNIPIQSLFAKLRGELTLTANAKGLDLRVVDSSLVVHTDPHLLEQMVRNLTSNAFKYTKTGKVLLGCRRHGDIVSVEVWDTGIGIAEAELQAIFNEYHQIDNDARERSKGLGLGLSIVKRLGGLLGHQIQVRSRQSKGSVFAIEVGRVISDMQEPVEQRISPTASIAHPTTRSATILVIEDDPEIRDLLQQLLTDEGHVVLAVANGPAALKLMRMQVKATDLIISDYNLPSGMNGAQAIREIRNARGDEIPAIILTGDISTRTVADLSSKHLIRLSKPVKPDEVMNAIAQLLALPIVKPAALDVDVPERTVTTGQSVIFVIDDDEELRAALCLVLEKHGLSTQSFASSEAFLRRMPHDQDGCLLVDAYLPGMNGVELLQNLKQSGNRMPAIMITGSSDVQMAVNAMKAGAADFIEKPISDSHLLEIIERALAHSHDVANRSLWTAKAVRQIASLTVRQRQIMELVLAGHPSKNIAADLHISQRTVENHRASIMAKTGSRSLPALARLAVAAAEAA